MLVGGDIVKKIARLPDAVSAYAQADPSREAVVFGDIRISYANLNRDIDIYAKAMIAAGVRQGDRVAMLSTPRPEFLLALLGAMRIGAIWVGLNPKYRLEELRYVASDCRPALLMAILTDPSGRSYRPEIETLHRSLTSLRRTITLGGKIPGVSESLDEFLHASDHVSDDAFAAKSNRTGKRDPAVIVYTSGTTGKPKGAILSHDSFFHSYKALARTFVGYEDLKAGQRLICNLPTNHAGCLADTCGNALIDGGAIVFMETFDPVAIPGVIEKEKITTIGGLPLMHQMVFDQPELDKYDLKSLKVVAWGGAAMPLPMVKRLKDSGYFLSMHYGLTEGGSINSGSLPDYDIEQLSNSIGMHDDDNEYRVRTADGADAAIGQVGEIEMRGPGVMLGYFNKPEETAAAFTKDGWFKSGDLVEVLPDGSWRFVGRSVEMFKSGGYNVYPREIELALEEHPAVSAAAVIPVKDDKYDEVGWAFVIPAQGSNLSESDLKSFCDNRLANYKIPKRFLVRASLPMLPIGKVDKSALKSEAAAMGSAEVEASCPA